MRKSEIIAAYFNNPLSRTSRTRSHKISKYIDNLNNTINQPNWQLENIPTNKSRKHIFLSEFGTFTKTDLFCSIKHLNKLEQGIECKKMITDMIIIVTFTK